MERQTIVIEYVGETPTRHTIVAAFEALIHTGTVVDATVQPTITCLTEKEVAAATAVMAKKSASKGVTISIENPKKAIVFGEDKKEKLFNVLSEILNG